ncbi:MAG: prolipoprotein diacylglyceryl transferase [Deltaproteobacteria bacterium]|nr:prolipoprotein diacylglyceryl transferase [Deltaproteobacteria bacterium]
MWPRDIAIGPLAVGGYGLMIMLGVLCGLSLLAVTAPRAGLGVRKTFDLGFWLVILGILGSRLAYVVLEWRHFSRTPALALQYWQGGLMFQGGLLAGLLFVSYLALRKRLNFLLAGDALAPALALGQAIGRAGCLLAGCCYGLPAPRGFPFALTFPPGALAPPWRPLYPTQIMEGLGLALIAVCLLRLLNKTRPAGLVLASYLTLSGLLRLVVDRYRGDYRGPRTHGLVPTSWAALLVCLAGLVLGVTLMTRQRRKARRGLPPEDQNESWEITKPAEPATETKLE